MNKASYETIRVGIQDTSEAQQGKDIYYQCNKCQSIIPSGPKDNIYCSCGNIGIDKDLHRLYVKDYSALLYCEKKDKLKSATDL